MNIILTIIWHLGIYRYCTYCDKRLWFQQDKFINDCLGHTGKFCQKHIDFLNYGEKLNRMREMDAAQYEAQNAPGEDYQAGF